MLRYLLSLLILTGCSTTTKSVLLGTAIGGVLGGAIGQNNSRNSEGTMTGVAVGSGLGALFGYLGDLDRQKKEAKTDVKPNSPGEDFPSMTKPKLRSIWQPDRIEGNKYIRGHWIYVLDDPGSWTRD